MKIETLHEIYNKRNDLKINSLVDLYDLQKPEFLKYEVEILQLVEQLKFGKCWVEDFGLGTDLNYPVNCRMWEYIMCYLNTYTLPDSRVLDIGSGNSIMPIWLAQKGCKEVVAIDLTDEYLKCYGRASQMLGLKNLEAKIMDATDLKTYPDNYFDSIISVCVLEHIPLEKQTQALKEWARVCKYRLSITFDYGNGMDFPFKNLQEIEERIMKPIKETGMQMYGNLAYNLNPKIPYSSLDYTFGAIHFEKPRKCVEVETKYDWDKLKINKDLKLSCYMVVKDEDTFFDYAIKSVIEDIDELVIVDTGSTDNTLSIAKNWQCMIPSKIRIHQFEIIGYDLSEVRNFAMRQCTGDWILVVDGDEVWSKSELEKVRKLISNAGDEIAFRPLSVRPLLTFKKCEVGIWMERIFKNKVDFEYKGIYPGDLGHHKRIPYFLYMPWVNIHYFHLATMKSSKDRFGKWALYHQLSNPGRSWEDCMKSAQDVMHASGLNPNTIPCPFPIPEVLKDKLNENLEWKS